MIAKRLIVAISICLDVAMIILRATSTSLVVAMRVSMAISLCLEVAMIPLVTISRRLEIAMVYLKTS